MLVEQIVDIGHEPGGRHIGGAFQIQPHQIPGEGHGPFIVAVAPGHLHLPPQLADQALRVETDHTFSLTTTFTKSLGTSR